MNSGDRIRIQRRTHRPVSYEGHEGILVKPAAFEKGWYVKLDDGTVIQRNEEYMKLIGLPAEDPIEHRYEIRRFYN